MRFPERETHIIDIPPAWERIDPEVLQGTVLVIGAPDVGKSTFCRYLFKRLVAFNRAVAYLDGDPGQSNLGPPATMTLTISSRGGMSSGDHPGYWRSFVGSVSPRGHMLPMLVGASRLVRVAEMNGAQVVIYDTSGLVDPTAGGAALKFAKIDLLRPSTIIAIQRERELEYILNPLRRSQRVHLVELRPSFGVQRRDIPDRQGHRVLKFAEYFSLSKELSLNWPQLAVFPRPRFSLNRLLALEDKEGFALGLGIVIDENLDLRQVTLLTPLTTIEGVDALQLGNVTVNPVTFRDSRLGM